MLAVVPVAAKCGAGTCPTVSLPHPARGHAVPHRRVRCLAAVLVVGSLQQLTPATYRSLDNCLAARPSWGSSRYTGSTRLSPAGSLDATYTAANAAIPRAGAAAGRIRSYIMEQVLSLLENGHDPLPNKPADHLGAAGCQLPRLRRRGQHTGRVPPAALLATLS